MIYFLVTCSLVDKHPTPWIIKLPESYRIQEYAVGTETILALSKLVPNSKVIIIENNGSRKTFLNLYKGCEIYYTNNNAMTTKNKGIKELKDINDCIKHYKIKDDDFIVKVSGRYKIMDNSPFIDVLKNLNSSIDCILRYGSFNEPSEIRVKDCITGLIGMRCKYIRQIENPHENDPVEWKWALVTYQIPNENIIALNNLGLYMRPMNTAALVL
jgi:hypothetical protein